MWSEPILAAPTALAMSVATTPAVIAVARRAALLDVPNARSSHNAIVPRGGGVAVLVAAVATSILAAGVGNLRLWAVVLGAGVLSFVGLLDDRNGLPAKPRLAAQLLVPAIAAAVVVDRSAPLTVLAIVLASLWCASYVNAFNFMDGINGISASQAAITGAFLAFVARDLGSDVEQIASWAIAGSAFGFLPFNAVRPRVFLGDVGSYGIGFWLAAVGLMLWEAGASPIVLVGPFALYLGDTSTVLIRRWRRGDSLFQAHREHAYQLLNQSGWSHATVTLLCTAITMINSGLMFAVLDSAVALQLVALATVVLIIAGYLRYASVRFRTQGLLVSA